MESAQEKQQSEIIALKSIYAEDFIELQPRAWKGAARLHEFKIKITHLEQPSKVFFHLHTILPKTYPQNAHPTFSVHQPIKGLSNEQCNKLSHAISTEVRQYVGEEMVFQIATFAQDWLAANVTPPTDAIGSLAMQMTRRAQDEERAKKEKELALAKEAAERERRRVEAFNEQMQANAERQQLEKEKLRQRHRAKSDAAESEFPASPEDILTETFDEMVDVNGIRFSTVKLFHPKPASTDRPCMEHLIKMNSLNGDIPPLDPLGTIYKADPICDDVNLTLPLEVHALTFESAYYSSTQGKKKLRSVETELKRLCRVRDRNVSRIYTVRLLFPVSGPPRLSILMEERPTLTLFELLEDSGSLRPERALDYTDQTIRGLTALHDADLLHRGITLHTVGLVYDRRSSSKRVKLMNCAYYVKLLDLHRSNAFGPHMYTSIGEVYRLPDGWQSKDAIESSLHYTRLRDLHAVGVNLMQMLHGMNITNEYANLHAALETSTKMTPTLTTYLNTLCFAKKSLSGGDVMSILAGNRTISSPPPLFHSSGSSPISIPSEPKTPRQSDWESSPELDYFPRMGLIKSATPPPDKKAHSRYKSDFVELEMLGRGAFGAVVKALNTFDGGIYAVKKIKLRDQDWGKDNKIFREVEALSRLSHRYIVRYHSTWIETSEPVSAAPSEDDESEDGDETEMEDTADGRFRGALRRRKTPSADTRHSKSGEDSDPFAINFDSLTTKTTSSDTARSDGRTFPTIHFSSSGSKPGEDSDGDFDSDEIDDIAVPQIRQQEPSSEAPKGLVQQRPPVPKGPSRTLYIQMEFVERQTLKERIDEGISEDEAWRLFRQIVEALMHMASLNILHRDIKLTNIFIDSQGNCKVGDFGLATSSLQAVERTDPTGWVIPRTPEMTLDVGTRLYIAPEVQMQLPTVKKKKDKEKKPRSHSKADMYSLGIVFFEMNYQFRTGFERIRVVEDLRKPSIIFPQDWDPKRTQQRDIITWLLQHDPDNRPTALELSQSKLMPFSLEEEFYKGALRMMTQPDTSHYQATMNALFEQRASGVRAVLYDNDIDHAEYMSLNGIVRDTLASMLRLHGAIEMEPPLLMPLMEGEVEDNRAVFLDRQGEIVALPNNALLPFARMAARTQLQRIKRFYIGDIYRPNSVVGHPRVSKAAILDIITNDTANGANISTAECIIIVNEVLDAFPSLAQHYEIRISHSSIIDLSLNRIGEDQRQTALDIMSQTKSTWAQKRAMLLKKFFLRSTVDELEVLDDSDDDIDSLVARLERVAPPLHEAIQPYLSDIKQVIQFASLTVARPIYLHPLMIGPHTAYFKDGVCFEVVRRNKRNDILGAGGRYDSLIAKFAPPKTKGKDEAGICSVGVQLSLEKILTALAAYQAAHVKTFVKEQRSFGFWSPRRCDVYIVSYTQGHLAERLEVASLLWRHGISCDIMYESALVDGSQEDFVELCNREGMLFFLWPRPRSPRRDQPVFKIKSILKGTEFEVLRQELVPWLQQQIAEQKRVDATTSGAPVLTTTTEGTQGPVASKDPSSNTDVQLVLPGEVKKAWKQKKQMFLDKAFDHAIQIHSAAQSGIPMVAVDVAPATFDLMCKSAIWLTDDDAWKAIVASFPIPNPSYANQIRHAVNSRRSDGHPFVILFCVRDERTHLMTLPS